MSILALIVWCTIAHPRPACAEPTNRANYAEHHFQLGVDLMKQDNCTDAIPHFLKSHDVDPSGAALLNLATCYARLGRHATAWLTYRKAAATSALEQSTRFRDEALRAMSILSPKLAMLNVVLPKGTPGLALRLNGEPLGSDGTRTPLEPGESVLDATAPGRHPWSRRFAAPERGATLVIEIPDLRARREPHARAQFRVPAVMLMGVGASGIVTASALGLSARQAKTDADTYCKADHCTAQGVELRNRALDQARIANYAAVAGAVFAATGLGLLLFSPSSNENVRVVPVVEPRVGHATFGLEGRF